MAASTLFMISALIIVIPFTRKTYQSPLVGGDGASKCSEEAIAKIKQGRRISESEELAGYDTGTNGILRTFY